MKNYIAEMVDLTSDNYLNPIPAIFDNGQHIRNVGRITSIAVHHDATPRPHNYDSVARYKQEAREHYNRLGPGLQYHYKIDNTGAIFKIRPHEIWLYAVGTAENMNAIMICLDGYFHPTVNQKPTREQYEALGQLLVNLCEEHPEFPATYPTVYPHSFYSATACCGDTLRPFVNAIDNKASALAVPTDAVYDWPELQPPAVVVPPVDAVQPPAPVITYEDVNPAVYVSQVKTHLDDAKSGARIKDYEPGQEFNIVRRMRKNGLSWLQTIYSVEKTPTRGIPEKDLLLKNPGTQPVRPSPADPTQLPPVVEVPPAPSIEEQTHNIVKENNDLLKLILVLIKQIWDKISSVFK